MMYDIEGIYITLYGNFIIDQSNLHTSVSFIPNHSSSKVRISIEKHSITLSQIQMAPLKWLWKLPISIVDLIETI